MRQYFIKSYAENKTANYINIIIEYLPTTGSKTACVACSSPIGVLNQILFNLFAMGESSVEATKNKNEKIKINYL